MWHNSPTVKIVLAVIFLALVVDLAVAAIFGCAGLPDGGARRASSD